MTSALSINNELEKSAGLELPLKYHVMEEGGRSEGWGEMKGARERAWLLCEPAISVCSVTPAITERAAARERGEEFGIVLVTIYMM